MRERDSVREGGMGGQGEREGGERMRGRKQ